MTTVTWAALLSFISLFINLCTLFGIVVKVVRWIDRQKEQDEELARIRHEQSIITVGVLSCLKSIVGEKDEAEIKHTIKLIENHLNERAHE